MLIIHWYGLFVTTTKSVVDNGTARADQICVRARDCASDMAQECFHCHALHGEPMWSGLFGVF